MSKGTTETQATVGDVELGLEPGTVTQAGPKDSVERVPDLSIKGLPVHETGGRGGTDT